MTKLDLEELSKGHIHSLPKSYVPKELKSCEYIWLRTDRVRKSLEAPYTGPFKVVTRNDKYFSILLPNNVKQNVSIDRLKPAKIAMSSNEELPNNHNNLNNESENSEVTNAESTLPKISKTKSGRTIKWKKDNSYHYY